MQHQQHQHGQPQPSSMQQHHQQAHLINQQHHHHTHPQQPQVIQPGLHFPQHHFGGLTESEKRGNAGAHEMPTSSKHATAAQHHHLSQQHQQQHHRPQPPIPQHYPPARNHINSSRPQVPEPQKFHSRNGHDDADDDYQFLPMVKTIPVSRSQSAPPRKPPPPIPSTSSTQQVRVYVHEEPRSTRSSPSATLSKSLEESYLYSYLAQNQQQGGLTPSSSGGQSGYGSGSGGRGEGGSQSAFAPLSKKPSSVESLVSLSTEQNSTGHSRKSSIDFDRRSVVTVRRAGSKSALVTRQHSWEAGTSAQFSSSGKREQSLSTPQLSPDDPFGSGSSSRHSGGHSAIVRSGSSSGIIARSSLFYDDDQDLAVGSSLHKADSFEGHEEAVRSIVAAVQETRSLQRKLQSS